MSERNDLLIATLGSFGFHIVLVIAALFFSQSSNTLVHSPADNIVHAQLVSLEDLNLTPPEPEQRVIDLTKPPPVVEAREPDVLQMPTEEIVEQASEPEDQEEPEIEDPVEVVESVSEEELLRQEQQEIQDRQDQLAAQIANEMQAIEDQENQALISTYTSWIDQRIENSWQQPPSARNGMVVKLSVSLVPTGRVASVDIVESSGDAAFDRSAVQAVHRAEPYSRLTELSPELFDEEFRHFLFIFNPKDLRL